jgi:hypothetical protein
MAFASRNVANTSATELTYGGYHHFQSSNTMGSHETAMGDEMMLDSPDPRVRACHRYPPAVNAQYSLGLAQERDQNFPPKAYSNDRWIEDNQHFKTQACQSAAFLDVNSTELFLNSGMDPEILASTIGSPIQRGAWALEQDQNLSPKERCVHAPTPPLSSTRNSTVEGRLTAFSFHQASKSPV